MKSLVSIGALWCAGAALLPGATPVQDFQQRVAGYVKLRKSVESKLPALKKPADSQVAIAAHERQLAKGIRDSRPAARQGDIFTRSISAEFRRIIKMTMQGTQSKRIRDSLKSAEPVQLRLRVNDAYPPGAPLQSTPPTLLQNLPALPADVDYRVIHHDLILRDVNANLVIDFIPKAIP